MASKRKVSSITESGVNGRTKRRIVSDEQVQSAFRHGLLDDDSKDAYRAAYETSEPYRYGVIQELLDPSLLRNVRTEIEANLSFTPKETDIYKIHQSGDLANLDGLDDAALRLLPSLAKLRDALYSSTFRAFLSHVTGAGALSGTKTDMAVNVYTPTCHLLCHDDVIGSRRVSYILYLTDPDKPWRAEWGGALRLYPTEKMQEEDGSEMRVPKADFSTVIPPAFNQLSFFAVQPGESFHDVEEVYERNTEEDPEEDGGRVRMAISGWFHIPQRGEDGFEEGAEEKQAARSSLAQLQGKADKYDLPQPEWHSHDDIIPGSKGDEEEEDDGVELTEDDLNFLLKFLHPGYLTPWRVEELARTFSEESSLQLNAFLSENLANSLRTDLVHLDGNPAQTAFWNVARPPHKHRYLYRRAHSGNGKARLDSHHQILSELFPSLAFQKWLSLATGLQLGDCNIIARRFRRGLDYTLATNYDEEDPQLEVCLNMTPAAGWSHKDEDIGDEVEMNGKKSASAQNKVTRSDGDPQVDAVTSDSNFGGYELYTTGDEDQEEDNDGAGSDHGVVIPSSSTGAGKRREKVDPAVYRTSGEDEDDGILLTLGPSWNTLSIVLRDRGTLKFVKYISRSAPGDRWDIVGQFKVEGEFNGDEEDDEQEDDEDDDQQDDVEWAENIDA